MGKVAVTGTVKEPAKAEKKTAKPLAAEAKIEGTPVKASMPGLIIRFDVKVGDKVKAGDNIAVMEAMKMAIDVAATVDGTVKSVKFKNGDSVAKGDILAIIG